MLRRKSFPLQICKFDMRKEVENRNLYANTAALRIQVGAFVDHQRVEIDIFSRQHIDVVIVKRRDLIHYRHHTLRRCPTYTLKKAASNDDSSEPRFRSIQSALQGPVSYGNAFTGNDAADGYTSAPAGSYGRGRTSYVPSVSRISFDLSPHPSSHEFNFLFYKSV